jgi:subtilisin-like proprotein convertase family protein
MAVPGDGKITLTWAAVSEATSYNLYWSTRPGVTTSGGTRIGDVTSPQIHGGLTNSTGPYYYIVVAAGGGGEGPASPEASATPVNGATVADPLFANQWYLNNAFFPGEDINVVPVWAVCGTGATCRGEGIRIAVVDDGLEINHEDLAANVATGLSHNYINGTSNPTGGWHGTSVAGVIAARDLNGLGVRGVAPRANLVGYNLIATDATSTSSNTADSATRGSPNVHICNNSWGPPDGIGTLASSDSLWNTAIASGLINGRGGKGTVYLWAGGNGGYGSDACGTCVDNSNYDGYANHHGVIAVCAVGRNGLASFYSEPGANLLLCAPSSDGVLEITTTDRSGTLGSNASGAPDYSNLNYTNTFSGTSSATPTVAGVVALMLQANPNLGWRDVRQILAVTARQNDALNDGWTTNGAGLPVHHRYGFGVVDAAAAVTAATGWTNLGLELNYTSAPVSPNATIPDNNTTGSTSNIVVSASPITQVESVEVTFSASHASAGDLQVTLTSPDDTPSILAERHDCSGACSAYNAWVFSSVRHLNEAANGTWTLTVKDLATGTTGTFQSWQLKIYGRAL